MTPQEMYYQHVGACPVCAHDSHCPQGSMLYHNMMRAQMAKPYHIICPWDDFTLCGRDDYDETVREDGSYLRCPVCAALDLSATHP